MIKKSALFINPYIILLAICVFVLFNFSKSEIHLWSNSHNSVLMDYFFSIITYLGNGLFIITFIIIVSFYRIGYSFLIFSTYAISGIMVQVLKRLFFTNIPRPTLFFQHIHNLHLVKGVDMLTNYSFPSGHAATTFAFFLSLSLITRYKLLRVLFLILACLVAYSRVYLSQHFLIDIVSGSVIGVCITMIFYYYYQKIKKDWIHDSLWKIMFRRKLKTFFS